MPERSAGAHDAVPRYRNPLLTVDILIRLKDRRIVLIERKNPPFGWALPGGFVDYGESLEAAAIREAREETGLELTHLRQFRAYSDPARDPRQHTVTVVFLADASGSPQAADDAAAAAVFDLDQLPHPLAFDHRQILDDYRRSLDYATVAHDPAEDRTTVEPLDRQPGLDEDTTGERVATVTTWFYPKDGDKRSSLQWVVEERPITLFLNGDELVTLLCAGHHLDELAVGFLHAEGFIDRPEDLQTVQVDLEQGRVEVATRTRSTVAEKLWGKRTITSGCGKGTLFSSAIDALLAAPVESAVRVPAAAIRQRMAELNRLSQTYRRTHGVHNTALADRKQVLLFRDDIGRHNAVDMLVGHAFRQRLSLVDKMLLTTGRLTSEILIKAAKVGIPLLISRNTATTLAIELAKELNITLIGYVRAGNFTVYTGSERIG